jgi:putative colanic acid biosynthesis acetyltransferase WcaF
MMIKLHRFKNKKIYDEKNFLLHILWFLINNLFFNSFIPFNNLKIKILRVFGAKIGNNLIIKNYVKIKFPWKLVIGDNVWIGEEVWIDNISNVIIESNCCISQGVYICTASHNFKREAFDLITENIIIGESSWIGAKSIILLGAKVPKNSFVKAGSIFKKSKK